MTNGKIRAALARMLDNHENVDEILRMFEVQKPKFVGNPRKALHDIYDWWIANKAKEIVKYNSQTYDGGALPRVTPQPGNESITIWREEWLKLFLTSILQTMGRQNASRIAVLLVSVPKLAYCVLWQKMGHGWKHHSAI